SPFSLSGGRTIGSALPRLQHDDTRDARSGFGVLFVWSAVAERHRNVRHAATSGDVRRSSRRSVHVGRRGTTTTTTTARRISSAGTAGPSASVSADGCDPFTPRAAT